MNARHAKIHYAWVIAAVTFVVMLITSGVRSSPGLFMVPLEAEFGWSRAIISASIAVNIALFGLIGPFAASLMDRWGLRRVVLGALALMSWAVALSTRMAAEWQFFLLWGVLCAYYSLRGLSLLFLPSTLLEGGMGLGVFAVFYGLDWIATVPPTVKLTTEAFGKQNTGVVYGWIGASHQLGASMAAFGAGAIRTEMGDYRLAFMIAGVLCLIAGTSFIVVGRVLRPGLAMWQATD